MSAHALAPSGVSTSKEDATTPRLRSRNDLPCEDGDQFSIPARHTREQSTDDLPVRSAAHEWACMSLYILGMSVYSFQIAALGPTLPDLARNVDREPSSFAFSSVFWVNGLLQICAGPFAGLTIDYFNSHWVMATAILMQSACLFLIPTIRSLPLLLLAIGTAALFLNFLRVGIFTLSCQLNPHHTSSNLLLLATVFGVTNFCVPKAADWFQAHLLHDRLTVYWAWGVLAVAVGAGLLLVPSPKVQHRAAIKQAGQGSRPASNKAKVRAWEAWCIACCCALQFAAMGVEYAMGSWVYTYSLQQARLSSTQASTVTSVYWGVFSGVRILVALLVLCVRFTPASSILIVLPFGVAGAALALSSLPHTFPVLLLSAALIGVGNSTGFPNSIAMLASTGSLSGFANGILGALSGLCGCVVPTLVSLGVNSPLGWDWLFWLCGGLFVLHVPAIWVMAAAGRRLAWVKEESEWERVEHRARGDGWGSEDVEAASAAAVVALRQPLMQQQGGE